MRLKNMRLRFVGILVLLISGYTVSLYGQGQGIDKVGTTSFQFLKVSPDARSTALAEAYSSVVNTSEAVFWNPAGLTRVDNIDVATSYVDWLLDISHFSLAAAYSMGNIGTLGFQAVLTDMGEIEETRVDHLFRNEEQGIYNPGLTGNTLKPGSMVFGLSFARRLTEKFSFGLTAKYAIEDLVVQTASTFMFDGGVLFETGFKSLTLSAVLRHFGPKVTYFNKSYPLPQTFTLGLSGYLIAPESSFLGTSESSKLLLTYDLSQPRDYSQQHHIGAEYAFRDLLYLRAGYKLNFDEEGLTYGFGLAYGGIRIDYSYSDFGEFLDAVHRFSVGFGLN
jgi:hypothetical protein